MADKGYIYHPYIEFFMIALLFSLFAWAVYELYRVNFIALGLYAFFTILVGMVAPLYYSIITKTFQRFSKEYLNCKPYNDPLRNPVTLDKVVQKSWQVLTHILMTILGLYVMYEKNWYRDPNNSYFVPDPHGSTPSRVMLILYTYQFGNWTYSAIRHCFFESRRRDFYMLFVHHLATLLVELLSFSYGTTSFGAYVMLIHETTDILVEALKLSNLFHASGKDGHYVVETIFACNIIVWVVIRLYEFPKHILYGHEYIKTLVPGWKLFSLSSFLQEPSVHTQLLLLWVLFVLHIEWFRLFIKLFISLITSSAEAAGKIYEGDDQAIENKQE